MRLRLGRAIAVMAAVTGTGGLLAACSSAATSEGRQACAHVETSLRLYAQGTAAAHAGNRSLADARRRGALSELRLALPLAARAANSDGAWQPLMATLSESNRVPEGYLLSALDAQCSGVASG